MPVAPSTQQLKMTMMIIAGSLMMGPMVAGFFFLGGKPFDVPENDLMDNLIPVMMTIAALVASAILPNVIPINVESANHLAERLKNASAEEKAEIFLLNVYQVKMIIRFAILEGAAFVTIIFGSGLSPVILTCLGLLFLAMIFALPIPARVDSWVKHQMELQQLNND